MSQHVTGAGLKPAYISNRWLSRSFKEAVLTAEVLTSNEIAGRSCDRARRWSLATVRIFACHCLRDEEGHTVRADGFLIRR